MSICPECHQPIHHERFGVQMTPLKAAILDRIRASGEVGVSSIEIIADLYRDRRLVKPSVIKTHAYQLNDLLAATDWRLCSDRRRWFLRRLQTVGS
jgi:hypothetical protein